MFRFSNVFLILLLTAGLAFAAVPRSGDKAPDFSLQSLDGKKYELSELKGKVVLIGMFHI
ncbi:redoxin domain-containing protein, partial [candidate division KSB1 bacterium]|nr:redoxin domain-containing protein [candidate division KSB1 bacterium]NIS28299.1 redoxin domain-containing protein [candidate division KSB1 bacterium]NIU29006.1 redoxin domain-containing protein [candidate division KSB1 bacterium]NIW22898.1 redoxin domain-containing protein [candidate division KSB1 bacterium]NIW73487.1 redoxin domain-containing protein [candidate division KSB1 bacterium]